MSRLSVEDCKEVFIATMGLFHCSLNASPTLSLRHLDKKSELEMSMYKWSPERMRDPSHVRSIRTCRNLQFSGSCRWARTDPRRITSGERNSVDCDIAFGTNKVNLPPIAKAVSLHKPGL
jgi:hypothetical protein